MNWQGIGLQQPSSSYTRPAWGSDVSGLAQWKPVMVAWLLAISSLLALQCQVAALGTAFSNPQSLRTLNESQHATAELAAELSSFLGGPEARHHFATFGASSAQRSAPRSAGATPEFFVQVAGGNFLLGGEGRAAGECGVLYVAGTNKYELVEAGAGAPVLLDGKLVAPGLTAQAVVRRVLDEARQSGLNLLRVNAFAVDTRYSVLTQPGGPGMAIITREPMLRGLDYILDEARKRGLKVLLVLADYFASDAGGVQQYLQFSGLQSGTATAKAQFFTNSQAQAIYRSYIQQIVTRTNTISGRKYREDPTIFGWDIMNEPRCEDAAICVLSGGRLLLTKWVAEVATLVKLLDSIHPVTVGLDGFYSFGSGVSANPFSVAANYNADFLQISSVPEIDFASFNIYPDLWNRQDAQWVTTWVSQHASDGASMGKPVLVKELGMQPTSARNQFIQRMYAAALQSVRDTRTAAGGLRGANYFQAWVQGTEAVWWLLVPGGRWGITPGDAAYQSVESFAAQLGPLQAAAACPGGNRWLAPQLPRVTQCSPGWEGAQCDIDINECVRGTADCSLNAACINIQGGFSCQCFTGYDGDGRTCNPLPEVLSQIEERYYTNFGGNCWGSGADVAYPATSPGFAYDPTGTFPTAGNRVNATLLGCKTACDDAPGCTSFFYDPGQQQCFIKSGECPYNDICTFPPAFCFGQDYSSTPPASPTAFFYQCGQAFTYYKKGAPLPQSGYCQAFTAAVVAPGTAVVADALAGIPVPVVSLHWADLALISAGKIWMYNSTFETLQEHYTPAATPISLAALPDGRLAFADSAGAVFLESGPGSVAFNQLAGLSWRFLGAGGSAAQPVLWGAGASNSFQLSNFDVASGAVTEQATLPSTGLQSVERLAVDPQGQVWLLAVPTSGPRALFRGQRGGAAFLPVAHPGVALCDLAFDVFGRLFAAGYATGTGASCSSSTTIYQSSDLVGAGAPQLELAPLFLPATGSAGAPARVAAGPHTAPANFRGGEALVWWTAAADHSLRMATGVYSPNYGPLASTPAGAVDQLAQPA